MRWGLVPWWAKDVKVGFSSINARAETVDKTPAFRDAWKKGQRCLVITDGFYEWKKPEKQPFAIAMADKSHMVKAGLWDEWTDTRGRAGCRDGRKAGGRGARNPRHAPQSAGRNLGGLVKASPRASAKKETHPRARRRPAHYVLHRRSGEDGTEDVRGDYDICRAA
jgi:hypothetical protein